MKFQKPARQTSSTRQLTAKTCINSVVFHRKSTKTMSDDDTHTSHPLSTGKTFESLAELKQVVSSYTVREAFEFKTVRSSDRRYEIKCKNANCNWKILTRAIDRSSLYHIHDTTLDRDCFGIQCVRRYCCFQSMDNIYEVESKETLQKLLCRPSLA